ncbi:MAG: DNA-formamidopyrimidine glycosylase [Kurthia sp.]|nr:DNA-formamidopyrimidine glycosylase [Candidatus Kurthia equi]
MPELPEVEGVVNALKPQVTGKTIKQVKISETVYHSHSLGKQTIIKGSLPDLLADALMDMRIEAVERRSKYIYFHVMKASNSYILVNHLGMSGAWFYVTHRDEITEAKFHRHIHVELLLDDGHWLIYSDIRRFGELRLIQQLSDYPPLLALAPEPFDQDAKAYFLKACELRKFKDKEIKAVIMDSHALCGCGNIYATEALFRMKINPGRKTSQLSGVEKEQLFETIVAVLTESIAFGGSSISDYRNINGEAGSMQNRLQMYGMNICPMCYTNTTQKIIAGRNSYYCPNCQK